MEQGWHKGLIRVWPTHTSPRVYPEQDRRVVSSCPSLTGLCVSGGSTRAYAAAVGQLRGLTEIGLIPGLGYLSAVSGGAWAAAPYTYYLGSGDHERDILGEYKAPDALSLKSLVELSPEAIGYAATLDFGAALQASNLDRSVSPADVWNRAVGETYLAPYGLYDPDNPVGFTLDAGTRDEILARNPWMPCSPMNTVRDAKYPYLVVHASLSGPTNHAGSLGNVAFEFSPLAVGSPQLLSFKSGEGEIVHLGGGFIEPFAIGCSAPTSVTDADGVVEVELPPRSLTLADAVGASSAFSSRDRDRETYPKLSYWPVEKEGRGGTVSKNRLTDGGDTENYGLLALLGRRVRRIIVCINTLWPLSLDYDPMIWPGADTDPSVTGEARVIDPFLGPLFGEPSDRFPSNSVFNQTDYLKVVCSLQAAKRAGRTVMTVETHTVQSNSWWGIDGGWDVRICWLYNDKVAEWEAQLDTGLRKLILEGRKVAPSGPVQRFPHYLTRGQNPGSLVQLTPFQFNLLAHLSSWNVVANAEVFQDLFT